MRTTSRLAALGVGLLVGCSATRSTLREAPPATLQHAESVAEWQQLVRPDLLMLIGMVVAIVDAKDGECPIVSREGSRVTVQGGCTDASGKSWTGQARQFVDDTRVRARLRAFGHGERRVDGRVELRVEPEPSFVMNVVATEHSPDQPPHWLAIDARGRRTAGTWSAHGEVATDELGRVELRAEGIVLDGDVCSHEPLRGHLELRSAEQWVRIDYDGATDCDPKGTARWSLDGVDQGELEGVGGELRCNPDSNGSAPTGTGMLLGLVMLGRRRRTRAGWCAITPGRGSRPDRNKTEASTSEC